MNEWSEDFLRNGLFVNKSFEDMLPSTRQKIIHGKILSPKKNLKKIISNRLFKKSRLLGGGIWKSHGVISYGTH